MCPSLNETVLESVLANSPQLVLLHVVRCPKVNSTSILCLSNYTPMLRSLAITFVVRGQLQSFKPTIMQAGSGFAYVSANCPYPPPRTYTGSTGHRWFVSRNPHLLCVLFTQVASAFIFNSSEVWSHHTIYTYPSTSRRSRNYSEWVIFPLPVGSRDHSHYMF